MCNLIYQKETTWGSCAVTGTGGWNTAFSGHTGDFTGRARDGSWVGGLAIGCGFIYRRRGHTVCGLRQTGGGETWEENTLLWPYFHFQILLLMSYDSVNVSCTVQLCYSDLNLWKAKPEVSSAWKEDPGNFTWRKSSTLASCVTEQLSQWTGLWSWCRIQILLLYPWFVCSSLRWWTHLPIHYSDR